MSASPSECRDRRDEIIEAIREAGMDQDPDPLMQVPDLVEDAVAAGCIDAAHGEAIVEAARDLGDAPTVSQGQPVRKRVRAAFADATQDFGDLQAQRDEQTTLGESQRPQRRQVGEGARREDPEQGQVQFGERGGLRGQEQLGGGFAGPRPEEDEPEERERRRTEGVRSLKKFVEGEGEGPPPGEAAPPEREKREWTGSQDRATADKHYYALHFEGSVSVADTRRLLNKFQDARRVINLAKTSPATLRAMQGIGPRTVEKLAALDPDEVVLTPRERGTSETKLREAGIGPEGEGLGGFEHMGDRVEHDDGRRGTVVGVTPSAVRVDYDDGGDSVATSPTVLTVIEGGGDGDDRDTFEMPILVVRTTAGLDYGLPSGEASMQVNDDVADIVEDRLGPATRFSEDRRVGTATVTDEDVAVRRELVDVDVKDQLIRENGGGNGGGGNGNDDKYPVKVRFTGDARTKFHSRQLEPMHGTPTEQLSQGEAMLERATDVAGREKTNLVVQSDDELEAILVNLRQFRDLANPATGATWATQNHLKAVDRVISELEAIEGNGEGGGGGGGGGGDGADDEDDDEDVTITMRDPETGESTTLEIPREVNGWRYEPDAPGSRGTVVWTPPDEPDRYVSIQKTGGHTWAAIHEDRTDVEPGEPPEDDVFKTSRTGAGALDDAIAMMRRRDLGAGGADDDVDVEAVAARALRAAAEAVRDQDPKIRGEHETTHSIAFHAASRVNEDSPATGDPFDAVEDLYGDAINEIVYREGHTGAVAATALEDRADELDGGEGDSGNG